MPEKFPTTGAGKGDKYRHVNKRKYDKNYEDLFGDYCRFPHKHTKECKVKK